MQRFFFDMELKSDIYIDDKDFFHQISHVLRSRLDDRIDVFNGDGFEYLYAIKDISKKSIRLELISKSANEADPKTIIRLYQAIPNRFEKIDYIIQKGVEVGIGGFTFFRSERSSKLVISENKISRYHNIIKEALEQCGGNRIPELRIADRLDLDNIRGKTFVCSTKETPDKSSIDSDNLDELNIFVGPEGGFSDAELKEFDIKGFDHINFGKRILRTETVSSVLAFRILDRHLQ